MNIDEFKRALAASQEYEKWEFLCQESVSETDLANIEKRLRLKFPPCYRNVVLEFGSGQFHYVELLSLDPKVRTGVLGATRQARRGGTKDFVAISGNGCGDSYGFRSLNGECLEGVYFLDHETGEISSQPIAESFLLFLRDNALVLSTDVHLLATGRGHLVNKWWWW